MTIYAWYDSYLDEMKIVALHNVKETPRLYKYSSEEGYKGHLYGTQVCKTDIHVGSTFDICKTKLLHHLLTQLSDAEKEVYKIKRQIDLAKEIKHDS